jgi:hypothetical protein
MANLSLMKGDGDDEFLLALFGSLNRDDQGESIPVCPFSNITMEDSDTSY